MQDLPGEQVGIAKPGSRVEVNAAAPIEEFCMVALSLNAALSVSFSVAANRMLLSRSRYHGHRIETTPHLDSKLIVAVLGATLVLLDKPATLPPLQLERLCIAACDLDRAEVEVEVLETTRPIALRQTHGAAHWYDRQHHPIEKLTRVE